MRPLLIGIVIVAVLAVAVFIGYRAATNNAGPDHVAVFYTQLDGDTVVPWNVSLGSARDPASVAFYAATQAAAGPAPDVRAIRFPAGTIVRRVDVTDATAVVDLGGAVTKRTDGGSFAETGEFKALVWTLTALPHITSVRVTIDGKTVAALPGGQYELDEPLSRSSF